MLSLHLATDLEWSETCQNLVFLCLTINYSVVNVAKLVLVT